MSGFNMVKQSKLTVDDGPLIPDTFRKRFCALKMEIYSATHPNEARVLPEKSSPKMDLLDLLFMKDNGLIAILVYS